MMGSVDFNDRHLDPPDDPTHAECDGCHEVFDTGDLNKVGTCGDYKYLCDECLDERMDMEDEG